MQTQESPCITCIPRIRAGVSGFLFKCSQRLCGLRVLKGKEVVKKTVIWVVQHIETLLIFNINAY